ncbi:recombinase family protein [Granulibacter bethesdensis]|nr:recombinase family protein [Granulibacter bethesdensis]
MFVGYVRVSPLDQNPALQIDALKAAGCERIFIEATSGTNLDGSQLEAALGYMRAGDTLGIWSIAHLARSFHQLIKVVKKLEKAGIGLRVLQQAAIDTTMPHGQLIYQIFGAFAEFEKALITERTQMGLAAARVRGRRGGRPAALGEEEIRRAKAMLADPQMSVGEVAQQLGITQSTLYRHIPGGRSALASGPA